MSQSTAHAVERGSSTAKTLQMQGKGTAQTLQSHDNIAAELHHQDTAKTRDAHGKGTARTPHAL